MWDRACTEFSNARPGRWRISLFAGDETQWNFLKLPETLDKFITDPQAMVPANRMPYAGMANQSDRADLIAYLEKMSK